MTPGDDVGEADDGDVARALVQHERHLVIGSEYDATRFRAYGDDGGQLLGADIEHGDCVCGGAGDKEKLRLAGDGHGAGRLAAQQRGGDLRLEGVDNDNAIETFARDEELATVLVEAKILRLNWKRQMDYHFGACGIEHG